MGSIFEVTCDGCDLWRQDALEVGMMGVERHLCSCPTCTELVIAEREGAFDRRWHDEVEPLECPTCGTAVVDVATGDPCPCGGGALVLRRVGLWD
jgi:precorrin-6B methylase 1